MKETIHQHLREVEEEYEVKVLFAVESGSRAWGFSSPDSDWDVHFIYAHRPEWYMRPINTDSDVIKKEHPDKVNLVGYDIRKAFALLYKSNITVLEMIHSPIVYEVSPQFLEELHTLAGIYFNPFKVIMQYRSSIVRIKREHFIKRGVMLKQYLYHLHGLLACQYIDSNRKFPPIPFSELVEAVPMPSNVREDIYALIRRKSECKENEPLDAPWSIKSFTASLYTHFEDVDSQEMLDEAVRKPADPHAINFLCYCNIARTENTRIRTEVNLFGKLISENPYFTEAIAQINTSTDCEGDNVQKCDANFAPVLTRDENVEEGEQ